MKNDTKGNFCGAGALGLATKKCIRASEPGTAVRVKKWLYLSEYESFVHRAH
jgi:hypothetical protein